MTRRQLVMVCCALLSTASLFAQSPGKAAKADPITGTWTGELVTQGAPGAIKVTMELKFDGKSTVSGTVSGLPNPADVKTGTFDPKTGALKLQLGRQGAAEVLLVLEGKVVKDTAAGRFNGDEAGEFKIARKP